jgi:D-aminopeptidase
MKHRQGQENVAGDRREGDPVEPNMSNGGGRMRARDAGLRFGRMYPGPNNAITDVGGVMVGHVTLSHESRQTGVTVVVPHSGVLYREKVVAAAVIINGYGKATGISQVNELGVIETPIALTNTLAVGMAYQGLVDDALSHNPEIGLTTTSVNPVVAECNDYLLNSIRDNHVRPSHVGQAIKQATGQSVAEGNVGAGTGMVCYGWKGGIGTSSRLVREPHGNYVVGVLVLANFGRAEDLTIAGIPVGRYLLPPAVKTSKKVEGGSCVAVVATDAPLSSRQLARVARRVQTGLARTGTFSEHGSGEFAFAFSTARTVLHWPSHDPTRLSEIPEDGPAINALFQATVEAVEESVVNALFMAKTLTGRDGITVAALPISEIRKLADLDV